MKRDMKKNVEKMARETFVRDMRKILPRTFVYPSKTKYLNYRVKKGVSLTINE